MPVYGTVKHPASRFDYTGQTSDTAVTHVNNDARTITVEVDTEYLDTRAVQMFFPKELGWQDHDKLNQLNKALTVETLRARAAEEDLTQELFKMSDALTDELSAVNINLAELEASHSEDIASVQETAISIKNDVNILEKELRLTAVDLTEEIATNANNTDAKIQELESTIKQDIETQLLKTTEDLEDLRAYVEGLHPLAFVSRPTIQNNVVHKYADAQTRTVTWTTNKPPHTVLVQDEILDHPVSTQGKYTWTNILPQSNTLKVTVKYEDPPQEAQASVSMTFTDYVYYGSSPEPLDISKLKEQLSTSKAIGNVTCTVNEGEYFYYLVPTTYGTPLFRVGALYGGVNDIGNLEQTFEDNTVTYTVYRSTNPSLGPITVNIS